MQIKDVPVYYIRYEDLYMNPQKTLEEVFCFLLDLSSIEGLNIQQRITEVVSMGHSASVIYAQKVKDRATTFNRNIGEFSPEQRAFVSEKMKDFMHQFSYCSVEDGQEEAEWMKD